MFRPRINVIFAVLLLMFVVLAARLFHLQLLLGSHYSNEAEGKRRKITPVSPVRGRILDRSGEVLASSTNVFDIYLIHEEMESKKKLAAELSRVLEVPVSDVMERIDSVEMSILKRASGPDPRRMKKKLADERGTKRILMRGIPFHKAALIELDTTTSGRNFAGIVVEERAIRTYPGGSLTAQVLGYVKRMSSEEYKATEAAGYFRRGLEDIIGSEEYERLEASHFFENDFVGATGLEKTYDGKLSGARGARIVERDFMNRTHEVLMDVPPVAGEDLYLTIDSHLQKVAEDALAGRPGAAVVMDVHSGEILVLAASPTYDANFFVPPVRAEEYARLLAHSDRPLINRAISSTYPTGSLFKVVTATALMEELQDGRSRTFDCSGSVSVGERVFRCWIDRYNTGHGALSIAEAMEVSCNAFFYQAGKAVEVGGLARWGERFGFGSPTGIDLPFEAPGVLPDHAWKMMTIGQPWFPGDTINLSVGQGYLAATPLQVARMIAVVANGGFLPIPRIARSPSTENALLAVGLSLETLDTLRKSLEAVVHGEMGTARNTPLAALPVAGKTGTAQSSPGKEDHSWFAGYAPIENPRIAFAVIVEYGGHGADVAAPIVAKIVEAYLMK